LYSTQFGSVFKAKADFRVILNELGLRLFPGQKSPADRLSDEEIAGFYSRFEGWYQELPESLSPHKAVLPAHLKLQ